MQTGSLDSTRVVGAHKFARLCTILLVLFASVFAESVPAAWAGEREDTTTYKVVVNNEEQYSIWPASRENALGWKDAGKTGTKEECLAYIREVWTDMRPSSLRKKMEAAGLQQGGTQAPAAPTAPAPAEAAPVVPQPVSPPALDPASADSEAADAPADGGAASTEDGEVKDNAGGDPPPAEGGRDRRLI